MIHLRHLQFVVEVGNRSQPLDDGRDVTVPAEVDQQPLEPLDGHVGEVPGDLGEHRDPVVDTEHALLRQVDQYGDDHLVEQRGGPLDDV
jgi:hypothetical protein